MPNRKLRTAAAVILAVVAAVPYALAAVQIVKENLRAQKDIIRGLAQK